MSKMRNKYSIAFIIVLVLLLLSVVGTSVAYMFRQTDEVQNQFEPALVQCEITNKSTASIRNDGTIPAYLRVRLVTYWIGADGKIMDKPSKIMSIDTADGWVKGLDNTYYYSKPVDPQQAVTLLKAGQTLTVETDGPYTQVIEVFGEAIQSQPASAAKSAWGVTIVDGVITAP